MMKLSLPLFAICSILASASGSDTDVRRSPFRCSDYEILDGNCADACSCPCADGLGVLVNSVPELDCDKPVQVCMDPIVAYDMAFQGKVTCLVDCPIDDEDCEDSGSSDDESNPKKRKPKKKKAGSGSSRSGRSGSSRSGGKNRKKKKSGSSDSRSSRSGKGPKKRNGFRPEICVCHKAANKKVYDKVMIKRDDFQKWMDDNDDFLPGDEVDDDSSDSGSSSDDDKGGLLKPRLAKKYFDKSCNIVPAKPVDIDEEPCDGLGKPLRKPRKYKQFPKKPKKASDSPDDESKSKKGKPKKMRNYKPKTKSKSDSSDDGSKPKMRIPKKKSASDSSEDGSSSSSSKSKKRRPMKKGKYMRPKFKTCTEQEVLSGGCPEACKCPCMGDNGPGFLVETIQTPDCGSPSERLCMGAMHAYQFVSRGEMKCVAECKPAKKKKKYDKISGSSRIGSSSRSGKAPKKPMARKPKAGSGSSRSGSSSRSDKAPNKAMSPKPKTGSGSSRSGLPSRSGKAPKKPMARKPKAGSGSSRSGLSSRSGKAPKKAMSQKPKAASRSSRSGSSSRSGKATNKSKPVFKTCSEQEIRSGACPDLSDSPSGNSSKKRYNKSSSSSSRSDKKGKPKYGKFPKNLRHGGDRRKNITVCHKAANKNAYDRVTIDYNDFKKWMDDNDDCLPGDEVPEDNSSDSTSGSNSDSSDDRRPLLKPRKPRYFDKSCNIVPAKPVDIDDEPCDKSGRPLRKKPKGPKKAKQTKKPKNSPSKSDSLDDGSKKTKPNKKPKNSPSGSKSSDDGSEKPKPNKKPKNSVSGSDSSDDGSKKTKPKKKSKHSVSGSDSSDDGSKKTKAKKKPKNSASGSDSSDDVGKKPKKPHSKPVDLCQVQKGWFSTSYKLISVSPKDAKNYLNNKSCFFPGDALPGSKGKQKILNKKCEIIEVPDSSDSPKPKGGFKPGFKTCSEQEIRSGACPELKEPVSEAEDPLPVDEPEPIQEPEKPLPVEEPEPIQEPEDPLPVEEPEPIEEPVDPLPVEEPEPIQEPEDPQPILEVPEDPVPQPEPTWLSEEQESYGCETAFAYDHQSGICFTDLDESIYGTHNRWGWSICVPPGEYSYDIYAGAAQCDTNKGEVVGRLEFTWDGNQGSVTYIADDFYKFDQTHFNIGWDALPKDSNGDYTVAPGQYSVVHDVCENSKVDHITFSGIPPNPDGQVCIIAHTVSCDDF